MSKKLPTIQRVVVSVRTLQGRDRDYPAEEVKIPEWQVGPLYALLAEAQRTNQATTMDDLVRALWRGGVRYVRTLLTSKQAIKGVSGEEARKLGLIPTE